MILKWKYTLLVTLLTIFQSQATNVTDSQETHKKEIKKADYRLPKTIIPTHYELMLYFSQDLSFRGTVKIKAIVQETTDKIVLNYDKLRIKHVEVLIDSKSVNLKIRKYDAATETYSISLENTLIKGTEISIAIVYSGEKRYDLKGLYNMDYVNKKGEKKSIAATQFSPIFARRAFPCFDEPAFKAFFKVHIRRPKDYVALSNMPLKSSKQMVSSTDYDDVFEESLKMSTYLVGIVVGDLKSVTNDFIKIWTREDVLDQTKFALNLGKSVLKQLESFFEQSYQIHKLDMVALPKMYFSAMENWGLITFRETQLLVDKKDTSVAVQQEVAEVIAHECAHMWFGNLVTPDWWGYLWLKEAFAGYYEFRTLNEIQPGWKMNEQILLRQQSALLFDSLPSSAAISRNVNSPSEIMDMFDDISYKKGFSILRMMDLSFGRKIFDSASLTYLQARQYRTGTPADLFASFQLKLTSTLEASVEKIMNTWTEQSGYPVLYVQIKSNQVKIKQKEFSLRKENENSDKKWWIPITWFSKSSSTINPITDVWINSDQTITVEKDEKDWLILNVMGAGFYRVNYDAISWLKIIKALQGNEFTKIPIMNRAAIIDDLLNLARANILDYHIALKGLEYLKQETDYLPFKAAFNSLDYLARKFSGQPEYKIYSKYMLRLIKNIHSKLGFNENGDKFMPNALLRRDLNMLSCNFGHQDCVTKSMKYFHHWRNGTNARVPKNLKSVVYTTAIKKGGDENWYFLESNYKKTNIVSERKEILNALSCSQNPTILDQYLRSFLINPSNQIMYDVNLKDIVKSILSCSPLKVEFLLDFIGTHYQEILKLSGNNLEQISSILSELSGYLSTRALVDKFQSLINSHNIDSKPIMPYLESLLESAKFELNWYDRNSEKIIELLEAHDKLSNSEDLNYML